MKYLVNYTWHSGECFGVMETRESVFEIDNLDEFKKEFEDEKIDGSYCSINIIEPLEKCFNFEITASYQLKGYVFAKDIAEAHQLILDKKWDEIDDGKCVEVNSIDDMEEDDVTREKI